MKAAKFSRFNLVIAVLFLVVCFASYFWISPKILYRHSPPASSYPPHPHFTSTDRITIVAPHLDDESLGAGGLIAEARQENIPVSIIFMTNGDDFPLGANLEFKTGYPSPAQLIQFGVTRQEEAIRAAAHLGVTSDHLYFLGLPDRGLAQLQLSKYASSPYTSSGTQKNSSAYSLTAIPNLSYTGDATHSALATYLNATAPTRIYTTSTIDKHTDHIATAQFVEQVLPEVTSKPLLYHFLIHHATYPFPKGINQQSDLLPPPKLRSSFTWQDFPLSSADEQEKNDAIQEYKTQLRVPESGKLLNSMIRKNELFFPN